MSRKVQVLFEWIHTKCWQAGVFMHLTLDQKLVPILEKLQSKYLIGMCEDHCNLWCFVFAPKGWHFELNTAKLKVWANAIVSTFQFNFITALMIGTPASKGYKLQATSAQEHLLLATESNWLQTGCSLWQRPSDTMSICCAAKHAITMDGWWSPWLPCIPALSAITILSTAHTNDIPSIWFTIRPRSMGIPIQITAIAKYTPWPASLWSSNDRHPNCRLCDSFLCCTSHTCCTCHTAICGTTCTHCHTLCHTFCALSCQVHYRW